MISSFFYLVMLAFGWMIIFFTITGTIELAFLTIGALLPKGKQPLALMNEESLVIIIPAHNEERVIDHTLKNLLKVIEWENHVSLVVIADNCTDGTIDIIKNNNVRFIERKNTQRIGKGYALEFAFDILMREGYELFVVIDADSMVDSHFITQIRLGFGVGAIAIQVPYKVRNAQDSLRTRLQSWAFEAFNGIRPEGRQRWGLSAGILGNGFALKRSVLEMVPYRATSLVEDLEYHLYLVLNGLKVTFITGTAVYGLMPIAGKGPVTQKARWEGGRLRIIVEWVPRLFFKLMQGNIRLLEPLADLLLMPLSYHTMLLFVLFLIPSRILHTYAFLALLIVVMHTAVAWKRSHGSYFDVVLVFCLPFYFIWKLALLPTMFKSSRKSTSWQRTERAKHESGE